MKEVNNKVNNIALKVHINGFPDLSLMPKNEFNLILASIYLQMTECFKKKQHFQK